MFEHTSNESLAERALETYDSNRENYENALALVEEELRARLAADPRINLHDVRSRVKDKQSFEAKVRKDPRRDVEDVLGIRVITYFRDDAIWVEQIIRSTLIVREGTYTNKADLLADREFGYRSIQFIAAIPPAGFGTGKDDDLRNMITQPNLSPSIVEIQIRSVLEHAWAEVEHDVYKRRELISRPVRRRFALTAALIENADDQLEALRDELSLAIPVVDEIEDQPDGFVQRFIENDRASMALDAQISAALDLPIRRPPKYIREVSRAVSVAGFQSTQAMRVALSTHPDLGLRMSIVCTDVNRPLLLPDSYYDSENEQPEAFPGIGIYWLSLGLTGQAKSPIFRFPSVSPARLTEYGDVGQYLLDHPSESALSVRDRYRASAHPSGTFDLSEHDLALEA